MFGFEEIAGWCGGVWHGDPVGQVRRVVHDTRGLRPGDLYVAICGERFDGHAFVSDAFALGAAGVVAEAPSLDGPTLVVENTRRALLDLASGYRGVFAGDVVAITGSAGKTTVKDMTAWVLAGDRGVGKSLGNWNNDVGMPLSLLSVDREADVAVMELGMNHAGELAALCEVVRPRVGCVTEVGLAHRAHFVSEEAIAEEKAALLRALPEDGLALVLLGRPWSDLLLAAPSCRVVTLAMDAEADYSGRCLAGGGLVVREKVGGVVAEYPLAMPGGYMARNTLLVVALCRSLGVGCSVVAERLGSFVPEGMRWRVEVLGGRRVVNDAYNANPLSMRASIEAFSGCLVEGRAWLVLGDMNELGEVSEEEHRKLGVWLTRWGWYGVLGVGERARGVVDAARSSFKGEVLMAFDGVEEAGRFFVDASKSGDCLLLKGSRSMRLEQLLDVLKG